MERFRLHQTFDLAPGADQIDLAGVATSFGQTTLHGPGANTAIFLGTDRIDGDGVTTLSASDFLLA